jgi:hypothetical protein
MTNSHLKKKQKKNQKYTPTRGHMQQWFVAPLTVITAGARGAIYQTTKIQLKHSPLKLKTTSTKKTLKAKHHNADNFFMHIILIPKKNNNQNGFLHFSAGCYDCNKFLDFLKLFEVVDMDCSFPMRC